MEDFTEAQISATNPEHHDGLEVCENLYHFCGNALKISRDKYPSFGSYVWEAGLVLCEYFEKEKMSFTGKKVIELGSGTGIVGILAVLLGGNVTFTDQTFILKKMKYNISVNIPPWLTNHTKVCALSWDDDLSCFPTDYDVILGSDIVYSSSSYPSLLQTLQHLSNHSTTIYISSDVRPVNECNVFHAEMLPKHFHCERVHQSGNNRIHVYKLTKKQHTGDKELVWSEDTINMGLRKSSD